MLPLISKPISIGISADGAAVRLGSGKTILITQENIFNLDANTRFAMFDAYQNELEKKQINIILSHHFVRFLVLPWQQGVYSRQDWEAIAKHRLKKIFGSLANDWEVEVAFSKFGGSVLVSAMNKDYLVKLNVLAQHVGFKLQFVSPLFEKLKPHIEKWPAPWLVIVEPERVLLAQYEQDICQCVTIESPPKGQEYKHAKQLLKRMLLKNNMNENSVKILTFVSPVLQNAWPAIAEDTLSQCLMANNRLFKKEHHATWMVSI